MGIKGSPTCVLNFENAAGYLIGSENKGLNAMFTMMNEARLGVGVQSIALSEIAYQNSVIYSKERIQGKSNKEVIKAGIGAIGRITDEEQ